MQGGAKPTPATSWAETRGLRTCPTFVMGQMSGKVLGTHAAFESIIIDASDKVLVDTIFVKSDDEVEFFLRYFF